MTAKRLGLAITVHNNSSVKLQTGAPSRPGGLGVMIEEGRAGVHPHDVGESEKVANRTRLALLAMDSLMKL